MKFFSFNECPLHLAVENENINIIKLLLGKKNIDTELKNQIFKIIYQIIIKKIIFKYKKPVDLTRNDEIKKIISQKSAYSNFTTWVDILK